LRALAWLSIALLPSTARADHPPDPFADAYRPPVAEEVGTGAGQTRLAIALGAAGFEGAEMLGQTIVEQMTIAFIGVRLVSSLVIAKPKDAHTVASFHIGTGLHLLPYRMIDLGLYVEGGLATVDPFNGNRALMPEVAGGLTIDIAFDPYWFLRLEGDTTWGVLRRDNAALERLRFAGIAGIGYIL
jgi:hypothetical protein